MSSIFSKIIAGEIPSYKVYEDNHVFAFLDIRPMVMGHTLVIPKVEIDYLFDMEDELYSKLMVTSKRIAHAIKSVVPCRKVGMTVIGLEVPHAHVHLMPINQVGDMSFGHAPVELSSEEMLSLAQKIASKIQ